MAHVESASPGYALSLRGELMGALPVWGAASG